MAENTEVVVIGGGYAGVMAANRLTQHDDVTVTLVNPRASFVERIRLHQLVGGSASGVIDYQDVLARDVGLVVDTVTLINAAARTVTLATGDALRYDYLVYAVGSDTADLSVPGAAEFAHPTASLEDAQRLRSVVDRASTTATVTVVGGGPLGIETAAELAELGRSVTLVCGAQLGPYLHPRARRSVSTRLSRLGVTTLEGSGTTVTGVTADAVQLRDGRELPSSVTIWTPGFGVPDLASRSGLSTDAIGRLLTDETLTSVDDERIVATGDAAAPSNLPLRMSCQAALPLGSHAADTVLSRMAGGKPTDFTKGIAAMCISLGRRTSVFSARPQGRHRDVVPRRRPARLEAQGSRLQESHRAAGGRGAQTRVAHLAGQGHQAPATGAGQARRRLRRCHARGPKQGDELVMREHILDPATESFVAHRNLLFTVAYEILGSATDAEDVLQETWLRWVKVDLEQVRGHRAYLVRITTRQSLNRLRTMKRRREEYVGPWLPEPLLTTTDVAEDVELAESLSMALMLVLETLSPTERAVFVLREAFGVDYDEIAAAVDKSPAAVRQIAHRARRHVEARRPREVVSPTETRATLAAFQHALETGDFQGLLGVLAPDVVMVADGGGIKQAALRPIIGAEKVVRVVGAGIGRAGFTLTAEPTAINGSPAFLLRLDGELDGVLTMRVEGAQITGLYYVRNPEKLSRVTTETLLTRRVSAEV